MSKRTRVVIVALLMLCVLGVSTAYALYNTYYVWECANCGKRVSGYSPLPPYNKGCPKDKYGYHNWYIRETRDRP